MGLFTRNYSRPGRGVDKDAPEKTAFFMFFELVGRKFFRLVMINIFYFIIISPIFILFYGYLYGWLITRIPVQGEVQLPILLDLIRILLEALPENAQAPLVILSVMLQGPFTMGFTYMMRNMARQEHTWTSDFFTRTVSNHRQGIVFSLLDALAVIILLLSFSLVSITGAEGGLALGFNIWKYVCLVLFVFYLAMRVYFYQLAVTVELPVLGIIKNSAIFAVLGLWRNALALVCCAAAGFLALFLHPVAEVIVVPLFLFSFCGFLIQFTTYPIVDKYIVRPAKALEAKPEEELPPDVLARMGGLPPELGGPGAGAHEDN
ncbi:MAG: hypothetical protein LBL09_04385 [Oscillospiraceae bacterium]|jgi:hypothetical protein|nr:hypothetical protein [Oscillospiraceae bacterium]